MSADCIYQGNEISCILTKCLYLFIQKETALFLPNRQLIPSVDVHNVSPLCDVSYHEPVHLIAASIRNSRGAAAQKCNTVCGRVLNRA